MSHYSGPSVRMKKNTSPLVYISSGYSNFSKCLLAENKQTELKFTADTL